MDKPALVYDLTAQYSDHRNVSGWAAGDSWQHQRLDGVGTIVEVEFQLETGRPLASLVR